MKKEESKLKEIIDYIRCAKLGNAIFRRNLMDFSTGSSTVDNYRNYLTHAGYLQILSRGVYKYIKEIPANMNYSRLVREAYPKSEWAQKYNFIPNNLDEAIQYLYNDENIKFAKECKDEHSFVGQLHFSTGMGLRNAWGLWTGSALQTWFKERGIHHADDMSGIILTSFYRKALNEPLRLNEQIQHYRDYWKKVDPKVNEGKL